jgi:hypothetical protein
LGPSDNLRKQAAALPQYESVAGHGSQTASIQPEALLARALERPNLQRALKQVRQNKGAPGIDGMSVDDLPRHLKEHWPEIRAQLVADTYRPQPVKWKQWGRSGYRELRKRDVSVREAWNTSKSAHGPWRLSKTPALSLALPARFFSSSGLPSLTG